MNGDLNTVYVGWDRREDEAYQVCLASLMRRTSVALHVVPLKESWLRSKGWFNRSWTIDEKTGARIDAGDGKPFSTDFAFTRFLVPFLQDYRGWALFCDCDFLFRADVAGLFALKDDRFAVQVVQHDHRPLETVKMDGVPQTRYHRKNWSSLVLWNCGHEANRAITPEVVSEAAGSYLHAFGWLEDGQIGPLPREWNWLEGWDSASLDPKAVHMTRGGPWMQAWRNVGFATDWLAERGVIEQSSTGPGKQPYFTMPRKPFSYADAADD